MIRRRKRPIALLALLAITGIVLAACGSSTTAQGDAIFDSRGQVAGAEGLFKRGDRSADIESKAKSNNLEFRVLEVQEFLAGTRNTVIVTTQPEQPFKAYVFLPRSQGANATMVVVKRDNDNAQAILPWDCSTIKIFLEQGGQSDFTNQFCS